MYSIDSVGLPVPDNSGGVDDPRRQHYEKDTPTDPVRFFRNIETCRWSCHIHTSSDCTMTYVNGIQYHVVVVKPGACSQYALGEYNRPPPDLRTINTVGATANEFWEPLTERSAEPPMVCSVDACTEKHDRAFVQNLFKNILLKLCTKNEYFTKYNTAYDVVHRHAITDGFGKIVLCNKHLLNVNRRPAVMRSAWKTKSLTVDVGPTVDFETLAATERERAHAKQYRYVMPTWERSILTALFPNVTKVPLQTQNWLQQILKKRNRTGTAIRRRTATTATTATN